MRGIKLIISDDHAGLKAARSTTLRGIPWQRCQFHAIRNVMAHVPKVSMRTEISQDLKRIFNADDDHEATRRLKQTTVRHQKTAPAHGVGRAQPGGIVNEASVRGQHLLVASIESTNRASIELHKRFGFSFWAEIRALSVVAITVPCFVSGLFNKLIKALRS